SELLQRRLRVLFDDGAELGEGVLDRLQLALPALVLFLLVLLRLVLLGLFLLLALLLLERFEAGDAFLARLAVALGEVRGARRAEPLHLVVVVAGRREVGLRPGEELVPQLPFRQDFEEARPPLARRMAAVLDLVELRM